MSQLKFKINKKIFLIILIFLILTSLFYFLSIKNETENNLNKLNLIGNDLDTNSCDASDGYFFSEIKKECIKISEIGINLNPIVYDLKNGGSAFALFENEVEGDKVEIYFPDSEKTVILEKYKNADDNFYLWANENYKFKKWKGMYTIEDANGKTLFQGPTVKRR